MNIINTNLGNKEIFSRNFKRYLDNSGRKKIEVAQAVKVSSGTITDWLKGRSYPRMDKLQLLADFFEIDKSDLVEDENFRKETLPKEDQKVLDAFHKVPKEKREFVLSMILAATDNL